MKSADIVILVEVEGGVVSGVYANTAGPVSVKVLDWDNVREGAEFEGLSGRRAIEDFVGYHYPEQLY